MAGVMLRTKAALRTLPFGPRLLRAARAVVGGRVVTAHAARQQMFPRACRHLAESIPDPIVVKVGAHDGLSGDVSAEALHHNPRWGGLMIEPVPELFERLKANLGDQTGFRFENVAVGEPAGWQSFYTVDPRAGEDPDAPHFYDQLGSFDRNHLARQANGVLEPYIREIRVEVQPLTALIARNGLSRVDVLQIDAEGFDYHVICTLDFAQYRPSIIFIEQRHLAPHERLSLLKLFRRHGYEVHDCGADYLALHRDSAAARG